MERFHTIISVTTFVILLLAVLRYRQHPVPVMLRLGVIIGPLGMLFSLAELCIGAERLNALLSGHLSTETYESWITVGGTEVSENYFITMQAFHLLGGIGGLLISIGLLSLVRRLIRDHHPAPPLP